MNQIVPSMGTPKPSFLGVMTHILRAFKTFIFHGFGVQRMEYNNGFERCKKYHDPPMLLEVKVRTQFDGDRRCPEYRMISLNNYTWRVTPLSKCFAKGGYKLLITRPT